MSNIVIAKSYTLRDENGAWLGQVVLTDDGMYGSVTDWGNYSYAWRSFGPGTFREFLCGMDVGYFANKMVQGFAYMFPPTKANRAACQRYAERILPALQKVLKEEMSAAVA